MFILIKEPLIKDKSLNWTERALLAYIEGFRKKGGCNSKNQTIAEVLQLSAGTVKNVLTSLSNRGFVIISHVDKKRFLTVNERFTSDTDDNEENIPSEIADDYCHGDSDDVKQQFAKSRMEFFQYLSGLGGKMRFHPDQSNPQYSEIIEFSLVDKWEQYAGKWSKFDDDCYQRFLSANPHEQDALEVISLMITTPFLRDIIFRNILTKYGSENPLKPIKILDALTDDFCGIFSKCITRWNGEKMTLDGVRKIATLPIETLGNYIHQSGLTFECKSKNEFFSVCSKMEQIA